MKRTKRNPAKSPVLPLLIAAGGVYLLVRKPAPAPVDGMGSFVSDAWDSVSNAAQQVRNVVRNSVSTAVSVTKNVGGSATGLLTMAALPLTALTVIPAMAVGSAVYGELKKDNDPPPPPAPVTVWEIDEPLGSGQGWHQVTEAEYKAAEAKLAAQSAQAQEPVYKDASGKVITKAQYEMLVLANTQIKDPSKPPTFQAPPAGTEWFWDTASAQWKLRYKSTTPPPTTTKVTTPQVTPPTVVQKLVTNTTDVMYPRRPPEETTSLPGSYSGSQNVVQYAPSGGATVPAPAVTASQVQQMQAAAAPAATSKTNMLVAGGAVVGVPLLLSMMGGD